MKRFLAGLTLAIVSLASITLAQPAGAVERILSYDSRVLISPDSSMVVTETIRVRAEHVKINRGIYRDFPTTYQGRFGLDYIVAFDVLSVMRDGHEEPFHIKRMDNGKRVYIGRKDVLVPRGEHVYEITYRTDRQIGFYENYDELFWNVNGNGWVFPVDAMGVTFVLPGGAEVHQYSGYTGRQGAKDQDYEATLDTDGNPVFSITKPLGSYEGLSVAVSWPKGHVSEPGALQALMYLLRDAKGFLIAVLAFGIMFTYYMSAWDKVGRDPERGVIMPRFHAPNKFSPASVRYIMRMGFDNKAFTAAVINLAVKGYVTITDEDGKYTLQRTDKDIKKGALSGGEKKVLKKLIPSKGGTLKLERENHARVGGARDALKKFLRSEYRMVYFRENSSYLAKGIGITVTALALMFFVLEVNPAALGILIHLVVWPPVLYFFAAKFYIPQWKRFLHSKKVRGFILALVFTPHMFMLVAALVVLPAMLWHMSWSFALAFVLMSTANIVFYHLLKAPTLKGRRIMDHVEGFAMYLCATEEDRLNLLHAPNRTPEHFEECLPYALALGLEQQWSGQFSDIIAEAAGGSGTGTGVYHWYHGSSDMGGRGFDTSFASALGGSLSTAIASSAVAPGSSGSSGGGFSGGGGSSGGGGGGGGGGGW